MDDSAGLTAPNTIANTTTYVAFAPHQIDDVITTVKNRVLNAEGCLPLKFAPYFNALYDTWPGLTEDRTAFLRLAIDIYMEIAETAGFMIEPEAFTAEAM